MHIPPLNPMQYAICNIYTFLLCPHMVPTQNPCIMRFMHYYHMHYDNFNCTSFDLIMQGPTDKAPIISPTSNSESYLHPAPAVSISTAYPSFSLPSTSSNIPDPQANADLGIVPHIPLSSPSDPVAIDTPLHLPSTFATSFSLSPPQGASFSHRYGTEWRKIQ